jgi:outer membrane protein insertion porin family
VRQIDFKGNQAFGKRQLSAVIKTSATNMLSFLTGGDVYDPDRIAQDQEQLRRYYRSKGYADASVPAALAEYDPAAKGFALSFTIDEGPLYRFGDIGIDCNIPGLDAAKLRSLPVARSGAVFDGNALDKTTESLAIELAKLGYPFAQAVPRMVRDAAARRIDVGFVIDQGPRTYVERIEIHGNSRTRDYVIRREFDIAEGDPYNKSLVDRAERHLKNLNYFKTVKISEQPGSAPDRIVLDVEAVDQPTGDFNVSGGYSTTDGALVELKIGERNFYGTGKTVQAAFTYGQYARGVDLAASEPYFLGTRVAAGIELFGRQADANSYRSYASTHLWRDAATGYADQRTTWRSVAAFDLQSEHHAGLEQFRPDAVAGYPAGRHSRPGLGFRRRQHGDLQHAGQHQEPDHRDKIAAQPGSGRPRRRREIPADHRGRPLLQIA